MPASPLYSFKLAIDGTDLTDEVLEQVMRIECVASTDALDTASVKFSLPFGEDRASVMALLDKLGKTLTVTLSSGGVSFEHTTDIIEASIAVGAEEAVTLSGLEALHQLRGSKPPKVVVGNQGAALTAITGRHGLTSQADGTDGNDPETFLSGDDSAYVKKLGKQLNYRVGVDDGNLVFKRRNVATGSVLELAYPGDVLSVRFRASIHDMIQKVTVHGMNPTQTEAILGEANAPADLTKISGGTTGTAAANALWTRNEVVTNAPIATTTLAVAVAKATLQQAANTFISGTYVCAAIPAATPGIKIKVVGDMADWPFTGPFMLKEARHVIDGGGYQTELDFFSDTFPPK
jgi:phage protein D